MWWDILNIIPEVRHVPYLPSLGSSTQPKNVSKLMIIRSNSSSFSVSVNLWFTSSSVLCCVYLCVCVCVCDSERSLSKHKHSSSSSLRGHLEQAPWKPNKAAGQLRERLCASVLKLRVSVGRCPLSGQHGKCRQLPGKHLAGISLQQDLLIFFHAGLKHWIF